MISLSYLKCFVIAQLITLYQEYCVNLFCHVRGWGGYRNYDTQDDSVNRYLFGLLFWGVGYHNNHHGDQANFNFARKGLEFDPTTILVSLIRIKKHERLSNK